MRTFTLVLVTIVMCAAGCRPAANPPGEKDSIAPDALSAKQLEQQKVALEARDILFQRLSGRLMEVMGSSGPVAAIAVAATGEHRGEVRSRRIDECCKARVVCCQAGDRLAVGLHRAQGRDINRRLRHAPLFKLGIHEG